VVQIRITGGSKTYNSDIRQFKMWTPNADYPQDFSDFIPETTIN
jgi:DNA gyrase inhibitor GyrI